MSEISNTGELRKVLVDVIKSVREGDTTPSQANSIANLSGKILQSAKLDIEVAKMGDGKGNNAIGAGVRLIGDSE